MNTETKKPASLDDLPDFWSLDEFAGVFRVSRATAYRMAAQGKIPVLRIGRRVIVSKEHLKRWVNDSICCQYKLGDEQNGET